MPFTHFTPKKCSRKDLPDHIAECGVAHITELQNHVTVLQNEVDQLRNGSSQCCIETPAKLFRSFINLIQTDQFMATFVFWTLAILSKPFLFTFLRVILFMIPFFHQPKNLNTARTFEWDVNSIFLAVVVFFLVLF